MMVRIRSLLAFSLSLWMALALFPSKTYAISYPALDTTSHWSIQDWGYSPSLGFYVQGAGKSVWTGPGVSQNKTAFYNLALLGARLNGTDFHILSQQYMGEMQGTGYQGKYGSFLLAPNLSLFVLFAFHDDGKFESIAYLSGSAYIPGAPYEMVLRLDYDMGGSGNNIAEFLWNNSSEGKSLNPPQLPRSEAVDGRLTYSQSQGLANGYWSTVAHEITVEYPPLARDAGSGVENAGFARIVNASSPQFGMVLWSDVSNSVAATFKAYSSYGGLLANPADVSTALQSTEEWGGYPRHAYAGRDQQVFLNFGLVGGGNTFKFGGKLFQRPDSRPLSVTVHQHPSQDLNGWRFDPDMVVRNTSAGARTFRNALADLAGPQDLTIVGSGANDIPYLPYDGYARPGQAITEAQLHNLMLSSRNTSESARENVRDWKLDLYLVNWTLQGSPDVWEAMFDYGGADANGIKREGAAIFWPALGGKGADFQRRQALLSGLHGVGSVLNMDAGWSSCPFAGYCWKNASSCGGISCGSSCPAGVSGCHYSARVCEQECSDGSIMTFADANHSTVRFNTSKAQSSDHSEVDWYRRAPESWVKPGRFGADPVSSAILPPFISN